MPITKSSKSNETPMEDASRGHLRPAASSSDKSVRLRVMSGTESKIYTLTDEQLEQFQRVVDEVFTDGGEYTQTELASLMGLKESDLVENYMTRFPGIPRTCD